MFIVITSGLYIVFFFYFSTKHYSKPQQYNIVHPIPRIQLQKNILFEFAVSNFLFLTTCFFSFILFENFIKGYLELFLFGCIGAFILVHTISRYYIHEGLVGLGGLIVTLTGGILIYQDTFTPSSLVPFIIGFSSSLVVLPTYGRFVSLHSKKITILTTAIFLVVVGIFILILNHYTSSQPFFAFKILLGTFFLITTYLFWKYKVIAHWVLFELIIRSRYKMIYEGTDNLKYEGGLCILSHHAGWVDWAMLQFPIQRRIHFFINSTVSKRFGYGYFIKGGGCIPMSKKGVSKAFITAKKLLRNNQVVGMFPEGSMTKTGKVGALRPGFTMFADEYNSKIIPVYIDGLWGSIFSRSPDRYNFKTKSLRRRIVTVRYGKPLEMTSSVDNVRKAMSALQ